MTADYADRRTKMVDCQLRTTDVTDARVLDAMLAVPRERFVPAKLRELAYIDEDIQIAPPAGGLPARHLMEPSPFARIVQLAAIRPDDFVLDLGCGTGYSTAVIARLASSAIGLECDPELARQAADRLGELGYDNAVVVEGPLQEGHAPEGPFDVIVVEGAVAAVPEALFAQLRDGGRLVAVEGFGNAGVARLYIRDGEAVSGRRAFNAAVKPLPGFEPVETFQFQV